MTYGVIPLKSPGTSSIMKYVTPSPTPIAPMRTPETRAPLRTERRAAAMASGYRFRQPTLASALADALAEERSAA